jgi:tetratricopeptide (TPR) repeat protein
MRDEGKARPHWPSPRRSSRGSSLALDIGARIHIARVACKMTQQRLAEPGFSKRAISSIERGKRIPSLGALTVFARRLGVPVAYLLGELDLDVSVLKEQRIPLFPSYDLSTALREEEAQLRLSQAEQFVRQDQPAEAWEVLGGRAEPSEAWPLLVRPTWFWLAGWTLFLLDRSTEAIQCLKQGVDVAEYLRRRASKADYARWDEMIERLYCFLGVAYCALDEQIVAFLHHRRGLGAIEQGLIRDPELKLWIYKGLGNEYFAFARYDEAISAYQMALRYARQSTNKRQHGYAAWGLAVTYQQQDDLFRAKTSYQEALLALGEHGNLHPLARLRAALGMLLVSLREYEEAEKHLQRSLESARRLNDDALRGLALAGFASLYWARRELEQATQAAREGLPLVQQGKDYRSMAHLYLVISSVSLARHDFLAAEEAFQAAVRVGKESFDRDLMSQVCQHYGRFLSEQARFQEAYQVLLFSGPTYVNGQLGEQR